MKKLKANKIGKRLYNSYSDWKKYISDQQQVTIIRKHLVSSIDNVKEKLNSLDDKFLGENNFFHEINQVRTKTTELKENLIKSLKAKKWLKKQK
tara:strand:+ start:580 stop:861 length:282 start_codon:yes stop_codon:yes gene_type:complete